MWRAPSSQVSTSTVGWPTTSCCGCLGYEERTAVEFRAGLGAMADLLHVVVHGKPRERRGPGRVRTRLRVARAGVDRRAEDGA
jgi:hypothetical protein